MVDTSETIMEEGMVRLFQGDCLTLMDKIPDESIDMVLCDMPFGTTHCSWDEILDLNLLWKQYKRIIKPNGAILLFAQTPFDKILGVSNIEDLRYEWIWEKTRPTGHFNANIAPMKAHENILVFYKSPPVYHPQFTTGHKKNCKWTKKVDTQNNTSIYNEASVEYSGGGTTTRYPRSVLTFSPERGLHPSQKPVELCEYFIRTYTNEGETVLDNCMGSGTCGIACLNTKRKFIGIELEEAFFNIAKDRIKKHLQEGVQETLAI